MVGDDDSGEEDTAPTGGGVVECNAWAEQERCKMDAVVELEPVKCPERLVLLAVCTSPAPERQLRRPEPDADSNSCSITQLSSAELIAMPLDPQTPWPPLVAQLPPPLSKLVANAAGHRGFGHWSSGAGDELVGVPAPPPDRQVELPPDDGSKTGVKARPDGGALFRSAY
jgi:hypothetical protein